jgi:hypothetical protein
VQLAQGPKQRTIRELFSWVFSVGEVGRHSPKASNPPEGSILKHFRLPTDETVKKAVQFCRTLVAQIFSSLPSA